ASQLAASRVIAAADSPAPDPKYSSRAGTKSEVDSPCRYSRGRTSATFGERRTYGGRIELRNLDRLPVAGSTRASSTRGALTSIAPAEVVTVRGRTRPFRPTRSRPRSSV